MKTTLRLVKWRMVILLADDGGWRMAQTNDLTGLLQQGLLEEQANQNLDAAITDYQTLATQFDKDRKVAATAVFRIGECYRMQGRTNEAAAQYGRVLRDFPDQKVLANLSQENLKGMGVVPHERLVNIINRVQPGVTVITPPMSAEASSLAGQIDGIEKLSSDPEEQGRAVEAIFPDENLKAMLLHLPDLQNQQAELTANPNLTRKDMNQVAVATSGASDTAEGWMPWFSRAGYIVETNLTNTPFGFGFRLSSGGTILETNLLPAAKAETDKQNSKITARVGFILENQKARLKVLEAVAERLDGACFHRPRDQEAQLNRGNCRPKSTVSKY